MINGFFSPAIRGQSDRFSSILPFLLSEMACPAPKYVRLDGNSLLQFVSH